MKKKLLFIVSLIFTSVIIYSCHSNSEKQGNDIDYYIKQTDRCYNNDNLDSANYFIDKALKLSQNNHYAFYLKGLITLDQEKPNLALQYFDKAILLAPDSIRYIEFNGISLSLVGDFEGAIREFSTIIEMDTLNALAYFNRAHTMQQLDLWGSAVDDYNMAEKLNSNMRGLHFQRATSYLALKKYDEFCKDMLKAKELGDERVTDEYFEICN